MSPAKPETVIAGEAPGPAAEAAAPPATAELVRCQDFLEFGVRAKAFLMEDEATNCLVISVAMRLAAAAQSGTHYAAVVQRDEQTLGAALRQGDRKLITTRLSDAAAQALAEDWPQEGTGLAHAGGPAPDITRFAEHYRNWTGRKGRPGLAQRLYRADAIATHHKVAGVMRVAKESDLPLVTQWLAGYTSETRGPAVAIERHIAAQRLHLWINNGPVAMASISGTTPNSARLSVVYTPPAQRGQGYGQAIVAGLGAKMLGEFRFCTLFTDIDNPVANSVYRKVGFKPACDFLDVHFG
jgi:predicted GNAT family acetyltransferase